METFCTPDSELPDWAQPKLKTDRSDETKSQLLGALKKLVFIVGTALLAFASVRNSLVWHFESFWGASKTFYQDLWKFIFYDIFGGNLFVISTFGNHIALATWFWFNSLFFMILDIYKPRWAMKYKIQEDKQLEMSKLYKAIRVCACNQFLGFIISIPIYFLAQKRGMKFETEDLPTFHWLLVEFAVFIVVEEIGFYYCHRLLHHPRIYKHIHKVHHEWTAAISIIGIYCHPIEHIFSNYLPVFMGPFIMGSHLMTLFMWSCIAITSTQISHGGYHLPFLPSPEAHDYHHLKFINNFGVMGILDRLHGTDNMFVKTKAYDRHIMLIGLTPAKQLFPDDPKKSIQEKKSE